LDRIAALAARCLAFVERQPLFLVALAASMLIASSEYLRDPAALDRALGDTDDATRLTEVRALLAGQPWFDMTLARFGGADPLVSHWSRLIDLPLAALMLLFTPVFGSAGAETAVRVVWPVLLDGVLGYCLARYCLAVAGSRAALLAIVLTMVSTGHFQFILGRIDHHNAMIIAAVGGTLLLVSAIDRPNLGWVAGLVFGVGCAIGLEGLALTIAALGLAVLYGIARGTSVGGLSRAAIAFAATLAACYSVFGPGRPDARIVCDALSTNLVMLAVGAAFGVGLADMARSQGASRFAVLALAALGGIGGLLMYGASQPLCLGGPYAQVETRLWGLWLNHVNEVRSLATIVWKSPIDGLSLAGFPLLGIAFAALVLPRRQITHAGLLAAIFGASVVLGVWQIRLLPYASYLAIPFLSLGLINAFSGSRSASAPGLEVAHPRLAFAGLMAVGALTLGGLFLADSVAGSSIAVPKNAATQAGTLATCSATETVKRLASLPAGLAANDLDLGPFLVAWTKLDVLSAPYHRMGAGILATHELFHAPASQARARMTAMGARYIVLCPGLGVSFPDGPVPADALRAALVSGHPPADLETVDVGGGLIKVWRLKAD
jgi:hypothetical protein